ncbi:hypothetical protein [Pseudomonas umsongensis]|uniref:Uncharacterized protein n=1 Tax=Pseudomonas umsongensis TaxID=198618 RepID=A0AAE6ZUW0_9PSED|nr:hypothetical protein [Pseudomonas umsongensis]QJC78441.1 hypothetical protein HGP31_08990 [Pseudomonas umsongensis]
MKLRKEQRGRVTVVVSNTSEGAVLQSGWEIQTVSISAIAPASVKTGRYASEQEAIEAAFLKAKEFGLDS